MTIRRALATKFHALHVEGGLFPVDFLERLALGDTKISGLTNADYHLEAHERLVEGASRSWSKLLVCWKKFQTALLDLNPDDSAAKLTRDYWLYPLLTELGYGRLPSAKPITIDEKIFPISHFYNNSPIHLTGCRLHLDDKDDSATASHSLVQDFLNRSPDHKWGIATNGYTLRLLRDNLSLTRQAYLEFDLQQIFDGELFSEFMLLWLLLHQSRLEASNIDECYLERWFTASREEGIRALDKLRLGVEKAIITFGAGFLKRPDNIRLKQALSSQEITPAEYYRGLLHLIYRLIFLFAAEDRDVLLDPQSPKQAKDLYDNFYSTDRLRRLARTQHGTAHVDLWRGLRLIMRKLGGGCQDLALPALGSFLWQNNPNTITRDGRIAVAPISLLMESDLSNVDLLTSLRAMCIIIEDGLRRTVNWSHIGAEELGSIYEALLELHPRLNQDTGEFELSFAAGHERKTTGSYYTPSSLVECLLDSALEPVIAEAKKQPKPTSAILNLKICDPACGSGHFLLAAGRRLARHLASLRSDDGEPSPTQLRHAFHQVVSNCLYGVDLNPMAVELCKVSLWMESLEPGQPLSFLDHHILHGNSLLGATPALINAGLADEAFAPLTGDDKSIASALKKQNKTDRGGQLHMFATFAAESSATYHTMARRAQIIDRAAEQTIEEVRRKEQSWAELKRTAEYQNQKTLADAWCAAFVWPKTSEYRDYAITSEHLRLWQELPDKIAPTTAQEIAALEEQYNFFHWHLAFPQVFAEHAGAEATKNTQTGWSGGFNVVLGNPPWERVKLQEKEFFSTHDEKIANAANSAARKKLIVALPKTNPALWSKWNEAQRTSDGISHLVRNSGRFPLCGRGDVNTYSVFAELNRSLISPTGRVGCIVPTGIATDDTTKEFFQAIVEGKELASIWDFENKSVFESVHKSFKFCLLTLAGTSTPITSSTFAFFLHAVSDLNNVEKKFSLSAKDIKLFNPNTNTCPVFRTRRDAEITKGIYERVPILLREGDEEGNPWGINFLRMFDMSNDSNLFRTAVELEKKGFRLEGNVYNKDSEKYLPLYEAKMIHHFDHRFGDYRDHPEGSENTHLPDVPLERLRDPKYSVLPRYFVDEKEVHTRLAGKWDRGWLLGWRDICRNTDVRTVIASVVPAVGVGNNLPISIIDYSNNNAHCLISNISSFILDFAARFKVGGTHLNFFITYQLAVLNPAAFNVICSWAKKHHVNDWLLPRVLELTYTAHDLAPFARDCGYDGPPFIFDAERRHLLRAELDAAFFHLYGINRDDVDYIMETFPIVKRHDLDEHGTFRTKETILRVYDLMSEAARAEKSYETILDPPPASPKVAHKSGK